MALLVYASLSFVMLYGLVGLVNCFSCRCYQGQLVWIEFLWNF